jgi:hypothetical protein
VLAGIGRWTVRLVLLAAVAIFTALAGVAGPAQASFASTTTAVTATVTTITVAPPTDVSTRGTRCTTSPSGWAGTPTTKLHAQASWSASATRGVTGYLVTAVFVDGTRYPLAQVAAPGTSFSGDFDASSGTQTVRIIVTTVTSYGWTAASAVSGSIRC